MYIKYSNIIKQAENLIEIQLKDIILEEYTSLFKDERYQEKLIEIIKESDKQEAAGKNKRRSQTGTRRKGKKMEET